MAHHADSADVGAEIIPFPTAPVTRSEPASDPTVRDAIGTVLREERTSQQRTLADVAEEAAVSLAYLSEIERGRKDVSSELLEAVCGALVIQVPDVLERAARHLRAGSNSSPRMMLHAA